MDKIAIKRKLHRLLSRAGDKGATALDLFKATGSLSMRERVRDLRKDGMRITRVWVKNSRNRGRHGRYILNSMDREV